MSIRQPFHAGTDSVKYIVEHRGGCVLIAGSVPMAAFATLVKLAPEGAVLDTDVARMTGSTFVFGLPDDLKKLRADAASAERQRQQAEHPGILPELTEWLAMGERGDSSEALFTRLSGVDATDGDIEHDTRRAHPYDTADFRRCRLMLEQCPSLKPTLQDAAALSPEWSRLSLVWAELCLALDTEAPDWRNPENTTPAPVTRQLIKLAINPKAAQ